MHRFLPLLAAAACSSGSTAFPLDVTAEDVPEDVGVDVPPAPDPGPKPDVKPPVNEAGGTNCISDDECLAAAGDTGPCVTALCNEKKQCEVRDHADGTPCVDADLCTVDDSCTAGVCDGALMVCDDENPCTVDECIPFLGTCRHNPAFETPCEDGDLCTGPDSCENGECAPGPVGCPPCATAADCAPWEDDDLCTGPLTCDGGECAPNPAETVDCSDTLVTPCEVAVCVPSLGACAVEDRPEGAACESASPCEGAGECNQGSCKGTPVKCDDDNPCTMDTCDPASGCVYSPVSTGVLCNDDDPCTTGDTCKGGGCIGVPVDDCP